MTPPAKTAILIDGDFFIRCYRRSYGDRAPEHVARAVLAVGLEHLRRERRTKSQLYRIFFYDCPPLQKKAHNPVSGRAVDFSKSTVATFRHQLHDALRQKRKIALRLGQLAEHIADWRIRSKSTKRLLRGDLRPAQLTEDDVKYEAHQKGVDMRIGLDIASMAYKDQVDQMILVSGDADFVPAAKIARREGIDFILDPMWRNIPAELHEHIDGLHSVIRRP